MTVVSNDPSWWPLITWSLVSSYLSVAAGVVVVYDWVLTLGQEIELIWRQRWSLMTVLYLVVRYIGVPFSIISILRCMSLVSLTDAGCNILNYTIMGTTVIVPAMWGAIIIARLHTMYQRSRTMLISLVIIFLVVNIPCGVLVAIGLKHTVGEELIFSGTYMCDYRYEGDVQFLIPMVWMLNAVWEVLTLGLSVWIDVEHFRDLRRLGQLTESTIGDCFRVLIKSHVLYFASFVCVSGLQFGYISPELSNLYSKGALILNGTFEIFLGVQMFVLGPRLILSVRKYNAKIVAHSDAATVMTSIAFQEHVHVSTSSTV